MDLSEGHKNQLARYVHFFKGKRERLLTDRNRSSMDTHDGHTDDIALARLASQGDFEPCMVEACAVYTSILSSSPDETHGRRTRRLAQAVGQAVSRLAVPDLFSDSTEDVGEAVLRVIGYQVSTQGGVGSSIGSSSNNSALPRISYNPVQAETLSVEFVEFFARSQPAAAENVCRTLLSWAQRRSLNEVTIDGSVEQVVGLLTLRKEKRLAALLGQLLEREARRTSEDGTPRALEVASVMTPLLASTPVVPFAMLCGNRPFDPRHPTVQYFSSLPGFPKCTHSDVAATKILLRGNLHQRQDLAAALLQRALKMNRQGVQAWLARAVTMCLDDLATRSRHELARDWGSSHASNGFALNLIAVVMQLFTPITDKDATAMASKIDAAFVRSDWRLRFSPDPKLASAVSSFGSPPDTATASASSPALSRSALADGPDGDDDHDESAHTRTMELDDDARLRRAIELSLEPFADLGFFPEHHVDAGAQSFNFLTEIFWIASRAMGIVPFLCDRYYEQLGHLQRALDAARRQDSGLGRVSGPGVACDHAERQLMLHVHGWETQLFDARLLTTAAKWAAFSAFWLRRQAGIPDAQRRFSELPAGLVKGMCDTWRLIASLREAEELMTGPQAADAALFCCEFLQRPDLISSPVVQAKFVDVIVALQNTARAYERGPADATSSPSRYFGSKRGFAGAVMDEPRIRTELAPTLMRLYAAVHAIEGLDVDADTGFDKFSVRHRANLLIQDLYQHPLHEPRESVVRFAATAEFDEFLIAAYDTITYNFHDALERVADGKRLEDQVKDEPLVTHPQHAFYEQQRRTAKGFMAHADSTFDMLNLLCQSDAIRDRLLAPTLVARTAGMLLSCVRGLCDEDKSRLIAVKRPDAWGIAPHRTLERPAMLIARCAAGSTAFASAVMGDADFEIGLLQRASAISGGESLRTVCDDLRARCGPEQEAGSAAELRWDDLVEHVGARQATDAAYEETLSDFSCDTVPGFSGGHYFEKKRQTAGGASVKVLVKELRKMKRLLPSPHPDGSIFVQFDEDAMNLARAVVSGPVGTPYFGGLFVFDIYFPPTYPKEPPLVQLVTTGQGTIRFNPNLYADGKVCLSLLGTWHGKDTEKWQPGVSSLYQVLMSIQSQILVANPYYNEPGREGQHGTDQGHEASTLYNLELRLATVRCAMAQHVAAPSPELKPIIDAHFHRIFPRLMASFKADLDTYAGLSSTSKLRASITALIEAVAASSV